MDVVLVAVAVFDELAYNEPLAAMVLGGRWPHASASSTRSGDPATSAARLLSCRASWTLGAIVVLPLLAAAGARDLDMASLDAPLLGARAPPPRAWCSRSSPAACAPVRSLEPARDLA